jgi:inward rectifier potassium channel
MFRIANKRESQLIDVDVQVTYKRLSIESEKITRQFIPLKLENHRLNMFPLSWTIIHNITVESPFWGKRMKDFEEEDIEILVYFKGYDETFSNSVHSRISYKVTEMKWGALFLPNFFDVTDGPTIHYLDRISDYEDAALPDLPDINAH